VVSAAEETRRTLATRIAVAMFGCALASLMLAAGQARPAGGAPVTITMLRQSVNEPADAVLISNFERVYPDIRVSATYAPTTSVLNQLELIELADGNGPDVLTTSMGCGSPAGVCELAKAGDLAPMVGAPWTKWSLPPVTSNAKYGQVLYAFEPGVTPLGIFSNDSLFAKLGLQVPQTFAQLLAVCRQARAAGTTAVLFSGGSQTSVSQLINDLAANTVYRTDQRWTSQLKAGAVSFDGAAGWHEALQEFIDMNDAGCFEPGVAGVTSATPLFAEGQGLMYAVTSVSKGVIDASAPQFGYSFHPFPAGKSAQSTSVLVTLGPGLSVNAHTSAAQQAAAQTFINFLARPKQNALAAQILGSVTQYEFLHGQLPSFMSSSFDQAVAEHEYTISPSTSWWNANVLLALQTDGIGLITGQETIDDVLQAMDAAWQQGPS
jgi:raffinose/stachyose/melibiose transport system substrate-binding protein